MGSRPWNSGFEGEKNWGTSVCPRICRVIRVSPRFPVLPKNFGKLRPQNPTGYDNSEMPDQYACRWIFACVAVCTLSILVISFCPVPVGTAPYAAVHGPMQQIGSQSDWRAIVARWTDPRVSDLLTLASCAVRSSDVQTLTCTRNC